jgi:hypothetical protein
MFVVLAGATEVQFWTKPASENGVLAKTTM